MASFCNTRIHQFLEKLGIHVRKLQNSPSGTSRWLYHDLVQGHAQRTGGDPFTIFDIGANVGQTAYRFHRSFPEARIFSFEPFPETFRQISMNVGRLPNVRLENLAMGAKEDELLVALANENAPTSELNTLLPSRQEGAKPRIKIKVRSVDSYCSQNGIRRINILKSDTEGYEMAVFEGAKGLLASKGIDAVLVEVKPPEVAGSDLAAHVSQGEVSNFLAPYGFEFWGLYDFSYHPTNGRMEFANALYKLREHPPADERGSP